MISKTPYRNDFNDVHTTCFDSFLPNQDIIELRSGGTDGVSISVKLNYDGMSTQLLFGKNADLTTVILNRNGNKCSQPYEITSAIKIHDGRITESECRGTFTLDN